MANTLDATLELANAAIEPRHGFKTVKRDIPAVQLQ
jgi:hypothetical protein